MSGAHPVVKSWNLKELKLNKITLSRAVLALVASFFVSLVSASDLPVTPAPEGAAVTIVSPKDGDVVGTEVTVIFGLVGMGVAPAGTDNPLTGHHHLLVDQTELPEEGKPMGNPPLHFGGGQTQTTLTLEPGTHTLQLIMGDKFHVPHNPPIVSEMITITVE